MYILAYFAKFFKNHALNFCAFGRKTQIVEKHFLKKLKILEEMSIEKMNFLLFLEKLLLKIEHCEITSFFYKHFFNFGGGGRSRFPPLQAPMLLSIFELPISNSSLGRNQPVET